VGDEKRDLTTIVGRDYSDIALTAKRVVNRLNTTSENPTTPHPRQADILLG